MEQGFIDIVTKMYKEQGAATLTEGAQFRKWFPDYVGASYKQEAKLLGAVVGADAGKFIADATDLAAIKASLVKRLEDDHFIAPKAAAEAVDVLALVLRGFIPEKEAEAAPLNGQQTNAGGLQGLPPTGEAQGYFDSGKAYYEKEDYDRAIADYSKAIGIKPDDEDAYFWRGLAYYAKGDYDRVIADSSKAIGIEPDGASAYNIRGLAYYDKGDYDRAIADYSKAIGIKPDDAIAYNERGKAYYQKGDYDRAIADQSKAIGIKLDCETAYAWRGVAYYQKGDYDRAIADFKEAVHLDPGNQVYKDNLENAYEAKGRR
jgi:tetratricopeptide (TPR) repeat protein